MTHLLVGLRTLRIQRSTDWRFLVGVGRERVGQVSLDLGAAHVHKHGATLEVDQVEDNGNRIGDADDEDDLGRDLGGWWADGGRMVGGWWADGGRWAVGCGRWGVGGARRGVGGARWGVGGSRWGVGG